MAELTNEVSRRLVSLGECYPPDASVKTHGSRPKFGAYFQGDWPYLADKGVGLEFCGHPIDAGAVVEVLQEHGCNPVAARRLISAVSAGEAFRTTVSASLSFSEIGDALAAQGLRMRVIPPARTEPDVVSERDYYVLFRAFGHPAQLPAKLEDEQEALDARVPEFILSFQAIPASLGRFTIRG